MKSLLILLIIVVSSLNTYAQSLDTLTTKRVVITTKIYRNGFKLSNSKILDLYKDTWQPKVKYTWGYFMNPVGPVMTVAGVGLTAVGLKGTNATAIIKGKEVSYKVRSLPKVLIGLGLTIGGLCIIEASNEFVQHSVDIYNARINKLKGKLGYVQKIDFGLTDNGNLGLSLHF
ncbi:hypothetical protein [Emticicia sp. 17c]|uniref:hypothetical protein n=1 Tax=Emticicia sp. 17c TaxID=3127704 RepID=UPI00301C08F9